MLTNIVTPRNSGLPTLTGSAVLSCPDLMDFDFSQSQRKVVCRLLTMKVDDFHGWLLGAANRLRNRKITPTAAFRILTVRSRSEDRSRFVPASEIANAVAKAYNDLFDPEVIQARREGFSCLDAKNKLASLQTSDSWPQNYGLKDLLAEAPECTDKVSQLSPAVLLTYLFWKWRGEERFITLGKKKRGNGFESETFPLSALNAGYDTKEFNFVVPNLASKESGFRRDNKKSNRCLDMFPDRHYLVLESDMGKGTEDIQAALIKFTMKILGRCPVMIVHSGGKSLHSWWRVEDVEEEWVKGFLDQMGGVFDRAAKTRCQLFRLPNGIRREGENAAIQEVLWVDVEGLLVGK